MAKKYLTKSKPAAKAAPKKYQFAGSNSSTYNQIANPYYVSGTYANQARQQADYYADEAADFGRYSTMSDRQATAATKEREDAKKTAIAETELQRKQEVQGFGQELAKATGNEALSVAKNELAKRAAKKAAEKTATDALTTAGSTAASAITPAATNTIAQGIAPALTTQAARGSGMEAARLAGNMIDETGSVVLPQAANTGAGVGNVVAAGTSTAAKTGLMAANMSGLASAGIGLGLSGAGMLVQRKMDTDPTKFDKKEGRQNVFGDALKSAGTGFGMGAALGSVVPGIGNVAGGIIGGIGGLAAGAIKGRKENKESEKYATEYAAEEARIASEEAKRKTMLDAQASQIAQNYNNAFINSRLSGLQTGFGYNTSTNMNMQSTGAGQVAETGGVKIPGGKIVPIKGSDAVEFKGRKHSQGGILLDPNTEVEGGETMDQVAMYKEGGKMNDYFFSAYLKLGGKSFAQRHKELIKNKAGQKEIQDLAKMQETVANKKGEKDRSPSTIKEYGGPRQYQTGFFKYETPQDLAPVSSSGIMMSYAAVPGFEEREKKAQEAAADKNLNTPAKSATAQSNTNAKNVTVRDQNKANAKAPSNQQSVATGSKGGTNNAGQNAANTTSSTNTPVTGKAGFAEGRRAVNKDEYGESSSLKGVPKGQTAGNKFYGNVTDQQYADMVASNPWYDFTNFDPANKTQVAEFQKAYNGKVKTGEKLKEDGKFGQQTVTALLSTADAIQGTSIRKDDIVVNKNSAVVNKNSPVVKAEEEDKTIAKIEKGVNGSLLAGLGQLIPVGYALARPYRPEGKLERMAATSGQVGTTSVRGALLPRINMNAERAAAERNTVATRNAIQNTNAGPGGIAAMMAANSAQNNQMLTIANQEQRANRELAGDEARLGMQASMSNAEMSQRANMSNMQNQLAVNQANLEASIQEARLKIDEKRYKREDILGALDTAASRIAGIVKDNKSYKAQERLAKAIDNTGSYDRFTVYEEIKKESTKKGSPYYGKTDVELKKIASDTYNELLGKMGGEAEEKKTGGKRKYTSRLGELSKGKKSFNI